MLTTEDGVVCLPFTAEYIIRDSPKRSKYEVIY